MSEKTEKPDVAENAGKVKGVPVIRRVEVANDDLQTRVLSRHLPAWVISGAVHVLVIGVCILFLSSPTETTAKNDDNLVTTEVEEPKEEKENLVNEDIGFDADLAAATNVDKEDVANVEAPKSEDPVGLENQPNEIAPQTAMAGIDQGAGSGVDSAPTDTGLQAAGNGGGGAALTLPGMQGRNSGATKDKLLKAGGGNSETEAAVARGLNWLARKQLKDGSWEYDGSSKPSKVAATGMALLPFLAAGETHKSGGKYNKVVNAGLTWLMGRVGSGGMMSANMYEHAIGAVCLCEAAGMTRDPIVKKKATDAIGYLVKAQAKNGSWGYSSGAEGDTSIVGWQIQALHSAKLAEIKFDKEKVYGSTEKFLNEVSSDSGAKYGYREKGASQSLTPVGLLSRYYMGWTPKHPAFGRGIEFLKQVPPAPNFFDMYYYYYATQVMHFYDGPDWHKFWNPKIRDLLLSLQNKSADENLKGSWDKDGGFIGSSCGRLGTTCLAILTLEVYYRHLPLYKRDNGGLAEMER